MSNIIIIFELVARFVFVAPAKIETARAVSKAMDTVILCYLNIIYAKKI
ncbi:MAG: hypothetical protein IKQ31_02550 [Clostridia bacterium]|nr:hypothetical protein [Clostridia bacterium]